MCGIIGYLSGSSIPYKRFEDLRDCLSHRGPDDKGSWKNQNSTVLLGHRRLSILDLSVEAHQPMISSCGRFVVVFNGEIYNYIELKEQLEGLGHSFRGSGDTEVVLAAYRQWGEACLDRFNGMFAFAIWDEGSSNVQSSLFMARDRSGKKPLYYVHNNGIFSFASELKAIPIELRGEINPHALNYYLALGYVPGTLCISQGVNKLPPAHAARYVLDTGEIKVWRWWALPSFSVDESQASRDELEEQTWALLSDAVKIRLRSDVPVGVLLSGGLDSSLIVASAASSSSQSVNTFTMGLPGSRLDESSYAKVVADHFGTKHHLLEVDKPSLSVLDELAPFLDEPIADSSLIPAYLVSKLTSQYVKVALGGDGGDELFGGYGHYTTAFSDQARFGWIPRQFFQWMAKLAGQLPPGIPGRNRLYALRGGPYQSLIWGSPYFDAAIRQTVLTADALEAIGEDLMAPELFKLGLFNTGIDPVDRMTRVDFGSVLPDDYLVKVDRASMAVGLEMRCPFLDVNMIEFAFSKLPSVWKVNGAKGRRLQRQLARNQLPSTLDINRKQGFSIPMNDWLGAKDLSWIDRLDSQKIDLIEPSVIDKLIEGQVCGRMNGARLFSLIMLSIAINNLKSGLV